MIYKFDVESGKRTFPAEDADVFNTGVASIEVGFAVALGTAMVIGLVSGLFVTQLKIPSFLVTLISFGVPQLWLRFQFAASSVHSSQTL